MRHSIRGPFCPARERRGGRVPDASQFLFFRAWLGVNVASCRMTGLIFLCEPTTLLRERPAFAPQPANAGLVIQVSVAVEGQR
jgi:hypothetical protein